MDLEQLRYYTRWHHHANERRYDAVADPRAFVHVDPTAVEFYTTEVPLNWGLGRIEGGDWDREDRLNRLEETVTYRSLVQRFEDGTPWEETPLYDRASEQFEAGDSFRGYETLAEFREVRCAYLDDLYRSIDKEGYRPNAEATHEMADEDNPFEAAYANHLEPLVVIGREGGIHWAEGYHRLVVAAILGLDSIPVYVLCRHEGWQRIRDRIHASGGVPADLEPYRGHPDLADVAPDP